MATFQLNEVIRLYEPCNILLCLLCKAGIKPGNGTVSHFRNQHKFKGNELQQVLTFAASIQHLSDPATVDLPQDGSVAIDGLPQLKGYSCMSCRYMTINRDNAMAHQRTEAHTVVGGPGWTVVTLQSFDSGSTRGTGLSRGTVRWAIVWQGLLGDWQAVCELAKRY
ncbi:hypothetical protein B0H66DRAFT_487755, partial [Apodospora peruviana]